MSEKEYDYLEQALPGFSKARLMVKAAGDSIRPLGFKGSKFELSADRPRSGILGSADPRTSRATPRMTKPLSHAPFLPHQINTPSSSGIKGSGRETSLGARRVVATEGGPVRASLAGASEYKRPFAISVLGCFITEFIRSDFNRRVQLAEGMV
jgi:hypothetical protein